MSIERLLAGYRDGTQDPGEVVARAYERARSASQPAWIELVAWSAVKAALARLRTAPADLPLYGVPFAIKDNIDLAGTPTTAACPAFSYDPDRSAFVVARLMAAGAIPIGKTNMDQFATGLTGTRTPHGACASVVDPRYVAGGSSSGSAVVVADGTVPFALGTDTAGSGRVPAAMNAHRRPQAVARAAQHERRRARLPQPGLRLDPHRPDVADAARVLAVAGGHDPGDPYSRVPAAPAAAERLPWGAAGARLAVPRPDQVDVLRRRRGGAGLGARARARGRARLDAHGDRLRARSPRPPGCSTTGPGSPSATPPSARSSPPIRTPSTRRCARSSWPAATWAPSRPSRGPSGSPSCAARRARCGSRPTRCCVPTAPTLFTAAQIAEEPIARNAQLGTYTNFVNLLDLCAVAVPAGARDDGLPFGVSLIAPAGAERTLLTLAGRWRDEQTGRAADARRRHGRAGRRRRASLRRAAQRPAHRPRRAPA